MTIATASDDGAMLVVDDFNGPRVFDAMLRELDRVRRHSTLNETEARAFEQVALHGVGTSLALANRFELSRSHASEVLNRLARKKALVAHRERGQNAVRYAVSPEWRIGGEA